MRWKSHLLEYVSKKQIKDHRTYSITDIARATNTSRLTVTKYMSNEPIDGINAEVVAKFSRWVGCSSSDLIEIIDDPGLSPSPRSLTVTGVTTG